MTDSKQPRAVTKRSTLLVVAFVVLASRYAIATFLSAFFSPLATQWQITPTMNGAIFAAYPLGMALTSLVAPRIIAVLGTRTAVSGGLSLGAVATAAFGMVPDLVKPSSAIFSWGFLITYFFNGLTGALAETACIILLNARFQDKLGQVMASVGSVCAFGCMAGPVVGGFFFDAAQALGPAWRFRMPSVVCAIATVAIAAAIHPIVPQDYLGEASSAASADSRRRGLESTSMVAVLTPSVVLNLVAVALSGSAVATLDPTLPYRLSAPPFGFSATAVSAYILGSSLVYVVVSVPIGWVVDSFAGRSALYKTITACGFLALGLAFALLAPLRLPNGVVAGGGASSAPVDRSGLAGSVVWMAVALAIKGVGSALSNNAVYPDLVLGFPPGDEFIQAQLSALWNAAYAIGWALGPMAGGWLYDALATTPLCTGDELLDYCRSGVAASRQPACSCQWAADNGFDGYASVLALLCVVFAIVCFGIAAVPSCNGAPLTPSPESSVATSRASSEAATPLLGAEHSSLARQSGAHVANPGTDGAATDDDDDGDSFEALLTNLPSSGPPCRWSMATAVGEGTRRLPVLSKAPSHRSITSRRTYASSIVTSVDAALEHVGLGWFHALALPILCLASMAQSLQTNLLSYMQPCAAASFGIEDEQIGLLSAVVFLTSAVATPLFGLLADTAGRKPATVISLGLMVAANVSSMMAPSFALLCAFQAVAGIGLGGTMVPFDLIAELSPPSVRGAVLNASNWMWSVGTIIVALVAAFTVSAGSEGWRVLVGAVTTPLLLTTALAPLVSESPHWHAKMGDHRRAVRLLRSMARWHRVALPAQRRSSSPTGTPPPMSNGAAGEYAPPSPLHIVGAADSLGGADGLGGGKCMNFNPITGSTTALQSLDCEGEGAASGAPSRTNAKGFGFSGISRMLADTPLRRRALLHWTLWTVAGFGWTGLVFFATFVSSEATSSSGAALASQGEPNWVPLDQGGCNFDYVAQTMVVASEVPGCVLVQFVIDRPWGPSGMLGGRRGVQVVAYVLCGLLAALMAHEQWIGANGVLVVSCVARGMLAAANSAM